MPDSPVAPESCRPVNPSGTVPAMFLREKNLIVLLAAFIISGIFFMLVPGTLLGVWNLIQIGEQQSAAAAALPWIQAHGHAQLFGWIGTFILGIGFYSIPNLRKLCQSSFVEGWVCLLLWVSGISLRWFSVVTSIEWRILLPVSALFEFAAVSYFVFLTMKGTRLSKSAKGLEAWSVLVITGTLVWLLLMLANLGIVLSMLPLPAPLVPAAVGGKFLFASVWGFVVPIVWGLSAKWLPALLGLAKQNQRQLKLCALLNVVACLTYACGVTVIPESLLLISSVAYVHGLKLPAFSDSSFAFFVRTAYAWLFSSAVLFLASAIFPDASGTAGAARHAITVGFLSSMVFSIGPKMLPAFLGRKKVFSQKAVLISLCLLSCGCFLRVSSEILAYDFALTAFWAVLPFSAFIELGAMGVFCLNMLATLLERPSVDEILSAYKTREAIRAESN